MSHDEQEIRQRIEQQLNHRDSVYNHTKVYVAVIALLWVIWLVSGGGTPWPFAVMAGWGIGLIAHWVSYYYQSGDGSKKRQQEIEQRTREELARQGYTKSKNDDL
jgi:hypothetical protein